MAQNDGRQHQGQSRCNKDVVDNGRQAKDLRTADGGTAQVGNKHNQHHDELPTDDEPLHVVSPVSQGGDLERYGMRIGVSAFGNGLQPHQGSLSTLDHPKPYDEKPKHQKGGDRWDVHFGYRVRLAREDCGHYQRHAKHQQEEGVDVFDRIAHLLGRQRL